jgi:energy-coupling factor transporter transmembrane protein EcfT
MTATLAEPLVETPGAAAPSRPRAGADAARRAAPVALGALVGALVAGRWETALLCVVVALGVALAARAPAPSRAWIAGLGIGVAAALAFNLALVPGRALFALPFGLHATAEGFERGVVMALRLLGATFAVHALRGLWRGERAADELASLARPLERLRVPVASLRMMAALALRFAPLLAAEWRRIAALQSLRAGRPPRGLGERLQRHRAAVVPALVSALERADRVALALETRHYRARPLPARAPSPWLARGLGLTLAVVAWLWRP